jgi:retinol dehydrogenase-13
MADTSTSEPTPTDAAVPAEPAATTTSASDAPKAATAVDGSQRTALQVVEETAENIAGKVYLIMGAYSGIGVETTRALLSKKGKVIVAGRNAKLQEEFVDQLKQEFGEDRSNDIDGGHTIDLGDLESVKEFANYIISKYLKLDCVILNAGVMMCPKGVTKDGFETQFGTNVVGHFLLAKLLLPLVKEAKGRYVWLSSRAHMGFTKGSLPVDVEYYRNFNLETSPYDPREAYQQSKLGDILLAKEFAKRFDVESVSLHPGVIRTNLTRHMSIWDLARFFLIRLFQGVVIQFKTVEQGAATTVLCATSPSIENGAYYSDCAVAESSDSAKDEANAAAVYEYCEEVTKAFQ